MLLNGLCVAVIVYSQHLYRTELGFNFFSRLKLCWKGVFRSTFGHFRAQNGPLQSHFTVQKGVIFGPKGPFKHGEKIEILERGLWPRGLSEASILKKN
jgi:hypothetical protein